MVSVCHSLSGTCNCNLYSVQKIDCPSGTVEESIILNLEEYIYLPCKIFDSEIRKEKTLIKLYISMILTDTAIFIIQI